MQTWRVIPNPEDSRAGKLVGPLIDAPCALGRAGVTLEGEKKEGDGMTPLGTYPVRQVFYRPDVFDEPICQLPTTPISPELGWCDDPDRAEYNRLVRLPFGGSHEKMWRDDKLYDLVLVIGHNDDPPVPGCGSAIFVHVAKDGFKPTEGCVAIAPSVMLSLLRQLGSGDLIQIG